MDWLTGESSKEFHHRGASTDEVQETLHGHHAKEMGCAIKEKQQAHLTSYRECIESI